MRVVEPVFAVKALHHVHFLVFESILVMRCLAMAVKVVESLAVRVQRVGVVFVVVQLACRWKVTVAAVAPEPKLAVKFIYVMVFVAHQHAAETKPVRL